MSRKLQLTLSDETFAYLEMLAAGLRLEDAPESEGLDNWPGFDKARNDFGPGVRELLEGVADSLAAGVRRPGAWERQVVDS